MATWLEQQDVIQMPAAAGASVKFSYSFIADAEQNTWSGMVRHCCARGSQ